MARKHKPVTRPPQGRKALIVDLPADVDEDSAVAAIREGLNSRAAEKEGNNDGTNPGEAESVERLRNMAASVRVSQVVEAKPGHSVISLPAEGSDEDKAMLDDTAREMYELWPWGRMSAAPFEQFRRENINDYVKLKALVQLVLAKGITRTP